MNRTLIFLLGLTALVALPAIAGQDDMHHELGSGDRVPSHRVGFEPIDNVPTVAPGLRTTTTKPRLVVKTSAAKPKPVAASAVVAVGGLHDTIRSGFAQFGPAVAEQAVRVAGCESTGDSSGQRLNPNATGSQGEVGLFQLHPKYQSGRAAKFGWSMSDLYDPAKNIAVAVDLYAESGWGPWTCRSAA